MSAISANLPTPPDNFSTTLSSAINTSALSIPLNSVSGLGTEGVGVLFRKDADGAVVAGSIEFIHWTNISGSSLTLTDTGDRGLTGSDSGAQSYSAGDYFEVWVSSYYYASQRTGFTAEHNQDGTHKETALDSMIAGIEAAGDLIYHNGSIWTRLAAGSNGQFLSLSAGVPSWASVGDWTSYTAVTPTTGTFDAPTYPIVFAGVDLTSVLYPGMRVKITQSTVKYFIVTAVAFSTDTTVQLYGGTDYSLVASGTTAISAFSYSSAKAPAGFPLDPTKWTVTTTDTSDRQQTNPVQNTWYNLGSITISIPIGAWRTSYLTTPSPLYNTNTSVNQYVTLSTANNSESDTDFTRKVYVAGASGNLRIDSSVFVEKFLTLASKTSYYLNHKTDNSTQTQLNIRNTEQKTFIRATSAYL